MTSDGNAQSRERLSQPSRTPMALKAREAIGLGLAAAGKLAGTLERLFNAIYLYSH